MIPLLPLFALIASPAWADDAHDHSHAAPGPGEVLRAALESADGLEVIISDISLPPHSSLPFHYHLGEEFVYVLEGSATHRQEGQDDIILRAGDSYHIPVGARHAPFTMDEPMRAVVFRVHVEGEPERILVEDAGD